jgi:hypothetical protein
MRMTASWSDQWDPPHTSLPGECPGPKASSPSDLIMGLPKRILARPDQPAAGLVAVKDKPLTRWGLRPHP